MMDAPSFRSFSVMRYSSSDSFLVREAVGSSMMMIRACMDRALAISTICCWATLNAPIKVVERKSAFNSSSNAWASRCISFHWITPRRTFSWPIKMFSVTVRWG